MVTEAFPQDNTKLDRRVARLEGAFPHLATRADLKELETTVIKWLVGIAIALGSVIVPLLLHIIGRLP